MFHPDDDGLRARAANEDDVLTPDEQRERALSEELRLAIRDYNQRLAEIETRAYLRLQDAQRALDAEGGYHGEMDDVLRTEIGGEVGPEGRVEP